MDPDPLLCSIASTICISNENPIQATARIDNSLLSFLESAPIKISPILSDDDPSLLTWYGADALFMIESIWELIQEKQGVNISFAQKYGKAWALLQQSYTKLRVEKIVPDAIIPSKAHPLDSGFDITVVRIVNQNFGPGVVLYGTGLKVRPPDGYYIDMVARSSLCRQGWMVANCIGVIDAQYRGELCVPLAKLNDTASELQLPARIAQIIIRPLPIIDVEEVENIGQTQRGTGGFGSSGQ